MNHFLRTLVYKLQARWADRAVFRRASKTAALKNDALAPRLARSKSATFLWTADEAEEAWRAGRTEYNLGRTFETFAKSLERMAGNFLVDGKRARVVICINPGVKKKVPLPLPPLDKRSTFEIQQEKRWLEKLDLSQLKRTQEAIPELQDFATSAETLTTDSLPITCAAQLTPVNVAIRCVNCDATKAQLEHRGQSTCCTEPFWTVPYVLIYRSLPGGEDR